jgi:rhodanese-related sulfurtransferase
MQADMGVRNVTPEELGAMLLAGSVVLVDVREPGEYAAEHIAGALPHPLSAFDAAKLPPGDVVFQCGSGKRSLTAVEWAAEAGLPHRAHLAGGIAAWKRAGMPTQRG